MLNVDKPAMAPTADCCCRGLAGDVKVRRHSRHTLTGRSDSLVIARSSDMAMIAVNDCCEVLESLVVMLNRLDSSHVESGDISDARTPAVDTSNCCSTLSFIIAVVERRQLEATLLSQLYITRISSPFLVSTCNVHGRIPSLITTRHHRPVQCLPT
jgi:hypothetical protein